MRRWLAVGLALAHASAAGAVIVSSGAGDPAPPSPDPGLDHVAVVAGLSGVYLGNGWLLTAGHVVAAARNQKKLGVSLAGKSYRLLPETTVEIRDDGRATDLALVRIDADPGLTPLEISRDTPPPGAQVILAGNGPLQETTRACWDAAGQPASAKTPGARCGFAWRKTPEGQTNGVQWGTNQIAGRDTILPGPRGARTQVFSTEFRDGLPTPREAQAGVGDSGGPVFVRSEDGFSLAGILLGVSAQGRSAAVFGDRSYAADLAVYRDRILRVITRE